MKIKVLLICIALLPVFAVRTNAEEYGTQLIEGFSEIVPDSVEAASSSVEEIAESFTIGGVVDMLFAEIAEMVSPLTRQLAILLGTMILISVVNSLRLSVSSAGLSSALEYITLLAVSLAAYTALSGVWECLEEALNNITLFMTGLIPMMTTLYAAGGDITTAAVTSAGMLAITSVTQQLMYYILWPVLRICFALALITGLSGSVSLGGVSSALRNLFTGGITFLMTIFIAVLGYQTNLALSADNLSSRAVKFVAGSYVPVVGGALGEAVRAIGGSITLLRSTVGTAAVAIIFAIFLPAMIQILLCRLTFSLTGTAARLLGCDREGAFCDEMRSMLGFGLALLLSCTVMFLFFVTMFARSASGITA